jgi:hypothetical protein
MYEAAGALTMYYAEGRNFETGAFALSFSSFYLFFPSSRRFTRSRYTLAEDQWVAPGMTALCVWSLFPAL